MGVKSLASPEVVAETKARMLSVAADDRPLWGKMTAPQMMWHLACSCEVALGERLVGSLKGPPTWLMKWAALRSGFRWPKDLKTTPELMLAMEESAGAEFAEVTAVAVERMEMLAKGSRLALSHPMFGSMTAKDWMRWGYLHADHHLRQFGR
jgi:DinB superfamily